MNAYEKKQHSSYENLETEEQFEREFGYDLRELQRVIQDLTAKNDTRRRLIVVGH